MPEIQSLARGLKILDLLAYSEPGLGIGEIATELAIDKSSALRLLQTLTAYGFTEKNGFTYKYSLGFHVVSLSRALLSKMPLRETARPYLKKLVDQTGECAHLGIHFKDRVLYIDQVESPATLPGQCRSGTNCTPALYSSWKSHPGFQWFPDARATSTLYPKHHSQSRRTDQKP